MRSFIVHAKNCQIKDVKLSVEEVSSVLEFVDHHYPKSAVPIWAQERRVPTAEEIRSVFPSIEGSSSPGLPFGTLASDKATIMANFESELIRSVQERFKVLAHADPDDLDPISAVRDGFCDPVRLFIKNEPHSMEKLSDGRLRLISSCSITDEIVAKLIFGNQVYVECINHKTIPSKPGAGISTDEQHSDLWDYVRPWVEQSSSTDVKSWDWTFGAWLFRLCMDCHYVKTNTVRGSYYSDVCEAWLAAATRTLFATSHGALCFLTFLGLMKSGMFPTAYFNSQGRAAVSVLASFPLEVHRRCFETGDYTEILGHRVMTMGDDCVEKRSSYPTRYEEYGLRVVPESSPPGGFSFCSCDFAPPVGCVPQNIVKSFVRLLSEQPSEERLDQFRLEFRHHPELDYYVKLRSDVLSMVQ